MFRILVVDDDPAAAYLLQRVMKNLALPHDLYFVKNGVDALDFLHCRAGHENTPRPNLILLDVHMPRLGGLETLTAIKNDPELCVIPVIMLSTGASPEEVRRSYEAHANCYVQKPIDLDRSVKLIQAIEAFWIDFALLPSCGEKPSQARQTADFKQVKFIGEPSGLTIAQERGEAKSRAMSFDETSAATAIRSSGCEEHNLLLDAFGEAVQELLKLHEEQFRAIVEGDIECNRFDLLIHMANEKKQRAKYAYLRHVEAHGCAKQ
jgi:CheY-like chemotaxis protein